MTTEPDLPQGTQLQDAEVKAQILLGLIDELLDESPTRSGYRIAARLDSRLEKDLGLDSLGRTELFNRVERRFSVALPERALLSETPHELLTAVLEARGQVQGELPQRLAMPGGTITEPVHSGTLPDALKWHVESHPERSHIFLYGEGDEPQPISYQDLWRGALGVAGGLAERGVRPGDRVALMLPTDGGYFFSFFGTLLAGAVPLPIYPPTRPSQLEEHLLRHARILQNAGARVLITVPEARGVARLLKSQTPELRQLVTPEELTAGAPAAEAAQRLPEDLAFLQYTSGSTGDPKGVMLTHDDLLANIRAMGQAVGVVPGDVFVSWLPLYHDMGLIGAWLGSLYYGMPLVVMSPLRFLTRPSRWLWAIHRHRGTLSAAPNFGYELCLNKVPPEQVEGLDLSSWRWAFNGAEPVSPRTLERFIARFAPCGFDSKALAPVYGLAEAAVGLAFPPPGRGAVIDCVRRDRLMRLGRADPVAVTHPDVERIVACGQALPGYGVRVVDADGQLLPERREGTLEFQGPSATAGYFKNPEATRGLYRDGWLDTGDRAYLADGDIYITGRVKELIIRGGRNIYPYEVEQAVGDLPGIRKGCVAVFAAADPRSGTERVVVVAETREQDPEARERLRSAAQECSTDLLGAPPDDVVIASPHTVLKTSSGKIRRSALRARYEAGQLEQKSRALWWQVARVVGLAGWAQLQRLRHRASELLYGGYAWCVFGALVPVVWLSVVLLPRLPWRWGVIRYAIRILRCLTGITLEVEGREWMPPAGQTCVLVANHISYLDTLALIDALPRDFVYVAKREFVQRFDTRIFLERLDTLFAERFDPRRGVADSRSFVASALGGRSLAFYPEGTFRREPGLLPFRMGAFVTAAEAGAAVVPVTIRGTRDILGAETWLPRRHPVRVIIDRPVQPEGMDWGAAVRLRDAVRSTILNRTGEPDLQRTGR